MWVSITYVFPVVVALLALAPLLIAPSMHFHYDVTPKIAIITLGIAVALLFPSRVLKDLRVLWRSRIGRITTLILACQAISLTISSTISADPAVAWSGSLWRRFGFTTQIADLLCALLLAGSLAAQADSRLRTLLRAVTSTGAVISCYAIAQYFGWDPWLEKGLYHEGEGMDAIVRPPGTLGHAAYLSTFLLHAAFFALALASLERTSAGKLAARCAAVLACAGTLLSGTRAALLGLLAGGIALAVLRARRSPSPEVRGTWLRYAAIVVAAGAAVTLFYWSPAGTLLRARTRWAVADLRGGARLWLWQDSLRMGLARPVAGHGVESFPVEFPRYQSEALARAYPDFYYESPHHILLEVLVAQGWPGVIAFLALPVCVVMASRRVLDLRREAAPILACLLAALVAQQFTSFVATTALYFYATVAMLAGLAANTTVQAGGDGLPSRRLWMIGCLAVTIAVWLGAFSIRSWAADHLTRKAEQALDGGDASGAAEAYQRALSWTPGVLPDIWYSRRIAQIAGAMAEPSARASALRQSLEAARRACLTAEDRHNAFYNLAALYAALGQAGPAEEALRAAIARAPNWFKPHWMLARVLLLRGRAEEAVREAETAVRLDGSKHPEVRECLTEAKAARAAQ